MIKKLLFKIFSLFDAFKDFLFKWGIRILIVLIGLLVLHNSLKVVDLASIGYTGEYKNLQEVYPEDEKYANCYVAGEGGKTIVILPGFGEASPVIEYQTLVKGLSDEYKVAVIEGFGYGYSMSMRKYPRTNENICAEIMKMLELAGAGGPYVFMAHGQSSIYAMYLAEHYPDYVQGVILLDSFYPKELDDEYRLQKVKDMVANYNYTSIFELTGYERIVSYIHPETFKIDDMQTIPEIYGDEEIKQYRDRIAMSYLSRTMMREINKMQDNARQVIDYKFSNFLPSLQIIATETEKEYKADYDAKLSETNLEILSNDLITNPSIQTVVTIEGDHNLEFSNPKGVIEQVKMFCSTF